jgi:hypothetical protein
MDFFTSLFSIGASNEPESEPTPSIPVDAEGGRNGCGGCVVA